MKKFVLYSCLTILFVTGFDSFAQPALNSLPGSSSVLYLDFDGHSDNSGWWSSTTFPNPIVTAASSFTTAQITEVFNRVSEDYRPFNLNVTTQQSVYDAAIVGNRQRVVITATSQFYTDENGAAGGVAYLNTFGSGEIACYVFTNFLGSSAKNAGEASSHEAGHTLGLNHHSKFNADCSKNTEYNPGKGSGQTKWAPIMGSSYSSVISQWYKGATNGSTCTSSTQDDLAVIITNNGFNYRTDDFGNTLAAATTLSFAGTNITQKGIISTTSDIDAFKVTVTAGLFTFFSSPGAISTSTYSGANLDIKMWLTNSAGVVLNTSDDTTRLDATLTSINLAAGTYYVFVEGVGVSSYKDIGGTGSFDYGSLGEYTLTVNKLCTPVITSTIPGNRCSPGMVVLAATTSAGTINWFATNTSTQVLGTGPTFITPSLFATTTYFVGATASGCGTASARVAVVAIVGTQQIANAGVDKTFAQSAGNQTLSGTPTGGIWSGMGVSSTGVFNPNRAPGMYSLTYCVTNNTCSDCDTSLITVTAPPTQVANPVISPGTATYSAPQMVSIACSTPGNTIYYTITGNTPVLGTGFTKVYAGPFLVSQTTSVKAMGVASGLTNSSVTSAALTINNLSLVSTPVITPPTGSYSQQQTVAITCATAGASIFYSTNGNIPFTSVNSFTKLYAGSFVITANTTVRALAVKSGLTTSGVAVSYITITNQQATVATPVITPGTGSYSGPQTVAISCATVGASIYFTTSGNTPVVGTGFTKLYSVPFLVSATTTVRAIGIKAGSLNSGVAVSNITLLSGRPLPAAVSSDETLFSDLEESTIKAYPNPSSGRVFLEGLGEAVKHIRLLDAKGQIQKTITLSKEDMEVSLDLSLQIPGLYLIQLVTDSGVKHIRVIRN